MKKLRGIFTALTFVGAGFLALVAVQASDVTGMVSAASCVTGSKYTDFDGSYSGRDTMTVWPKQQLCNDVKVNFSSFTINNTYNGNGFKNNPTALPQTLFYNKTVTLKKGTTSKTTVTVQVPDACKDYQIDAYIGSVQNKITTSAGLVDTTAIVAKLFQRTKTDCSPKMVKVCDPKTAQVISVPEADADKYKPVDDAACKPKPKDVQVCNPKTGQIITVPAADADKYKPVDDKACKPVKVCDPATGKVITVKPSEAGNYKPKDDAACQDITVCRLSDHQIVTIKGSQYDSARYSKDLDDCKPPTPHKVYVCNPATGEIIEVDEADASKYKPVDDAACKSVPVCDPSTGQIITVKKAVAGNYKPVDDAACQGEVLDESIETPPTTPESLPSTGPEQIVSALFGAGSLAGAGTAYIRSRRALRKQG